MKIFKRFVLPLAISCFIVCLAQFPLEWRQILSILIFLIGLWASFWNSEEFSWESFRGIFLKAASFSGVFLVLVSNCNVGAFFCRPLMVEHSRENGEAIVVLASGLVEGGNPNFAGLQRVLHGVQLFRENRAPKIFFSTGALPYLGHFESEWVASITQFLNLPPDSFQIVQKGTTTHTEAVELAKILLPQNIRRILVVTNGPHIFRTVKSFESQGFEVLPAPVHSPENVGGAGDSCLKVFDYAVHEWLGILWYWLRGYITYPFPK